MFEFISSKVAKKQLSFNIFILISFFLISSNSSAGLTPTPSVVKLGRFAAVCDQKQIINLLKNDPAFDVNSYPATMTPVQLAQERLVKAIVANEWFFATACLNTIQTIMMDARYEWRAKPAILTTDFMHLLKSLKDVSLVPGQPGHTTLVVVFNTLKAFTGTKKFDINSRITAPHSTYNAATAASIVAETGNVNLWCEFEKAFPLLDLEMRPSANHYTPLVFAVASNRLDMTKALIRSGADWYVGLDDEADPMAVRSIAVKKGFKEIEAWLIRHSQGLELATSMCVYPITTE